VKERGPDQANRARRGPHWCDQALFQPYFHGQPRCGLGSSRQTGWPGVVAKSIQQSGDFGL